MFNIIEICLIIASIATSHLLLANELFFDQFEPVSPTMACTPSFCTNFTMTSHDVLNYCKSNSSLKIQSRCCVEESNSTIIKGIDYTFCNIDKLYTAMESINRDSIKFVEIFDVRNNKLSECKNESYAGFVNLDKLYIPDTCSCPGSNYSWVSVSKGSCSDKKNICNTSFTNVNCTSTSECVDNGPGNFFCFCKEGYHGYKCLNEGEFPTLLFTSILCSLTIFLSAILWHTQRRHVNKKDV